MAAIVMAVIDMAVLDMVVSETAALDAVLDLEDLVDHLSVD
jgi:hypothetical protein